MVGLGQLEPVDLRSIWQREDTFFTPWLASEENLALLSSTLHMTLEPESTEARVGQFRADILCRDIDDDGAWVLIENQIERTDHSHLGQLITYAAGLEAATIVWIAAEFSEDHREALDWLNKNTGERLRFFGLEIEVWRIGDSKPAPKFNIVSKPNDWVKGLSRQKAGASRSVVDRQGALRDLWEALGIELRRRDSELKARKAYNLSWHELAIGRTGFALQAFASAEKNTLQVVLFIYGNESDGGAEAKRMLGELEKHRVEIEQELGYKLAWNFLDGKLGALASTEKVSVSAIDEENRDGNVEWLADRLEDLNRVFRRRVREL